MPYFVQKLVSKFRGQFFQEKSFRTWGKTFVDYNYGNVAVREMRFKKVYEKVFFHMRRIMMRVGALESPDFHAPSTVDTLNI